jgi:hypothetical protein
MLFASCFSPVPGAKCEFLRCGGHGGFNLLPSAKGLWGAGFLPAAKLQLDYGRERTKPDGRSGITPTPPMGSLLLRIHQQHLVYTCFALFPGPHYLVSGTQPTMAGYALRWLVWISHPSRASSVEDGAQDGASK